VVRQPCIVDCMEDLTLRQARELLTEWSAVVRSRDDRIRAAVEAGLSVTETAILLEIARTTVYRVLSNSEITEENGA
jgi:DNA invertase Pin-like site-specific DNA recombinase